MSRNNFPLAVQSMYKNVGFQYVFLVIILQAVAIGSSFAAVATNKRFLRIFTIGGVQRHIFSMAGPVVCMSGYKDQLMFAYHKENPLPGEQALAVKFLDLKQNLITEERVTLSGKATLSWLG